MFSGRLIRNYGVVIFVSALLLLVAYSILSHKLNEDARLLDRLKTALTTMPPSVLNDLQLIRDKYIALEVESDLRMQELLALKQKVKEQEEERDKMLLSLPTIFNSLPHLRGGSNPFQPVRRISKERRGVTLAFGVPTVRRQNTSYLSRTISSLLSGLTPSEQNDTLIIVFIAELNLANVDEIISNIKAQFSPALESGLLEVIAASPEYYPNLDNLPPTFGDPKERVKWRAKQNLDYAYLMMYAQSRALFYVQLEDDVIAKPGYAQVIKSFTLQQPTSTWLMLEFSSLGFIGKLFHSSDLPLLVKFFLIFFKDKPIDWLLDHVFHVKACNPEKNNKHCQTAKGKLYSRYKPSLFQHIGKESSLKGKKQLLIDKDFKKSDTAYAFLNPKASIATNFDHYKSFTAQRGYLGQSIFWAKSPHQDSVVRMIFEIPQKIKSFKFRTGNLEHPGDILVNASVEVLHEDVYQKFKETSPTRRYSGGIQCPVFENSAYVQVSQFNKKGFAEGTLSQQPLTREMRIRVLYDVTHNWVIISEFLIEIDSDKLIFKGKT